MFYLRKWQNRHDDVRPTVHPNGCSVSLSKWVWYSAIFPNMWMSSAVSVTAWPLTITYCHISYLCCRLAHASMWRSSDIWLMKRRTRSLKDPRSVEGVCSICCLMSTECVGLSLKKRSSNVEFGDSFHQLGSYSSLCRTVKLQRGRQKKEPAFTQSTESVNHAQLPLKTHEYRCHWQRSFQSFGTCDFEGLHIVNWRKAVGLDLEHSLGIFVLVYCCDALSLCGDAIDTCQMPEHS